jgi:hypothetical protein
MLDQETNNDTCSVKSAFSQSCNELTEQGYAVIPVQPKEKRPHTALGSNWARFADTQPTEEQQAHWETLSGAGIGLLTGQASNVVALDFDDNPDGVHAPIKALLPPCTVSKKGQRGETLFFQYKGEATRVFKHKGQTVLEILSDKRQTVLPPTIHKDTGKPYHWQTGDTLENTKPVDLPVLPENFAQQVDAIILSYGGCGSDAPSGQSLGDVLPALLASDDELEDLSAALAFIDASTYDNWVKVGNALRSLGNTGRDLWLEWSATSNKHDDREAQKKWRSFHHKENGTTYASVFKLARAAGWIEPERGADLAAQLIEGAKEKSVKLASEFWLEPSTHSDLAPPNWLIKKHLASDTLATIYGDSGAGKTAVLLDMLLCIATGKPWMGQTAKQGTVLYICGEGFRGVNMRVRAWCEVNKITPDSLRGNFYISARPVPFLEQAQVSLMKSATAALGVEPAVICVDTLNRNFGGGDENSSRDMTALVDALNLLRIETNACILISHHTGKNDSGLARGSSVLRAAMDTEMHLTRRDGGIQLACTKQKDAEPFVPVELEIQGVALGYDEDGDEVTAPVAIGSRAAELGRDFVSNQKRRTGKHLKAALLILENETSAFLSEYPDAEEVAVNRAKFLEKFKRAGITDRSTLDRTVKRLVSSGILIDRPRSTNFIIHSVNLDRAITADDQ